MTARAGDAGAGQPQAVDTGPGKGAKIGGITLRIAQAAAGENFLRFQQGGPVGLALRQRLAHGRVLDAHRILGQHRGAARLARSQQFSRLRRRVFQQAHLARAIPVQAGARQRDQQQALGHGGGRQHLLAFLESGIEQIDLLAHGAAASWRSAAPRVRKKRAWPAASCNDGRSAKSNTAARSSTSTGMYRLSAR